jgi:hypothetical protein
MLTRFFGSLAVASAAVLAIGCGNDGSGPAGDGAGGGKIRVEPPTSLPGGSLRVMLREPGPGHSPYWTFDEVRGDGRFMLAATFGGLPASAYRRPDDGWSRRDVGVAGSEDALVLPKSLPSGEYRLCNTDERDWCATVKVAAEK